MVVTISLGGFLADQMRYNLESSIFIKINKCILVYIYIYINIYIYSRMLIYDDWFHAIFIRHSSDRKSFFFLMIVVFIRQETSRRRKASCY